MNNLILKFKLLVSSFLVFSLLILLNTSSALAAKCVDTDGDGWGWDGTKSCKMDEQSTSTCVDHDGDGWGWDGNGTCRTNVLLSNQTIDANVIQTNFTYQGKPFHYSFTNHDMHWNMTPVNIEGELFFSHNYQIYNDKIKSPLKEMYLDKEGKRVQSFGGERNHFFDRNLISIINKKFNDNDPRKKYTDTYEICSGKNKKFGFIFNWEGKEYPKYNNKVKYAFGFFNESDTHLKNFEIVRTHTVDKHISVNQEIVSRCSIGPDGEIIGTLFFGNSFGIFSRYGGITKTPEILTFLEKPNKFGNKVVQIKNNTHFRQSWFAGIKREEDTNNYTGYITQTGETFPLPYIFKTRGSLIYTDYLGNVCYQRNDISEKGDLTRPNINSIFLCETQEQVLRRVGKNNTGPKVIFGEKIKYSITLD